MLSATSISPGLVAQTRPGVLALASQRRAAVTVQLPSFQRVQRLAPPPPPAAFSPLKRRASLPRGRAGSVVVQARFNNGSPDVPNRVLAALPYLLPLFDSLRYGKFVFAQFPAFAAVLAPFNPLIRLYFSVPFAGLVAFFAVYLGIINNQSLPRFVRFNAMQAVLLDILLILPGLLEAVFRVQPMGGAGLQIYITIYNAIFLAIFLCVAYGVSSCLAGRAARIPLVAEAADAQVR